MKARLILSALLLSSLGALSSAQSVCDQLQIVDIRYDAFRDSLLLVHVINGSPDIFSYPGFILYNEQGDTIAKETPNFFGIGQEQVHALTLYPDFSELTEVTDGSLELWILFFDTLVCTYDISEPVCPETDCNELVFSLGNLGGALTFGFFHYSVLDSAGSVVVEVDFTLEEQVQEFRDTICLPSGDYTLKLSADEGSVGGQPYFQLYELASQFWGAQIADYFNHANPEIEIPFSLYDNCKETINAVEYPAQEGEVQIISTPDGVRAIAREKQILEMSLYDLAGRLMARRSGPATELFIPAGNLSGMYLVRVLLEDGGYTSELAFLGD
ncbi:MAG: T9SS type A sorting domain-containing protein [Saprospirales bacterium]|nr:T9SS type A sorting domain-containing protein [Saprospirales bacterium]